MNKKLKDNYGACIVVVFSIVRLFIAVIFCRFELTMPVLRNLVTAYATLTCGEYFFIWRTLEYVEKSLKDRVNRTVKQLGHSTASINGLVPFYERYWSKFSDIFGLISCLLCCLSVLFGKLAVENSISELSIISAVLLFLQATDVIYLFYSLYRFYVKAYGKYKKAMLLN